MSITPEQKKRRFRELAKQDRLRTARELLEEIEQPFLFNEFKTRVSGSTELTVEVLQALEITEGKTGALKLFHLGFTEICFEVVGAL